MNKSEESTAFARVSIGMPVYNGEKYIAQALESFLKQTYTELELIISDNGSTDRTPEICEAFSRRDTRIRYMRSDRNRGASWNFNNVFQLAHGEYFKWAAHDDCCAPDYLAKCVEVLDRDDQIVLCHSGTKLIDRWGKPVIEKIGENTTEAAFSSMTRAERTRRLDSPRARDRFWDVIVNTRLCFEVFGLIRRHALENSSLIGPYYGSDKVLLAELALRGRFHVIAEDLFLRRCHSDQSSILKGKLRQSWINPHPTNYMKAPEIRCFIGYCRALWTAQLGIVDRIGCHGALFNHVLSLASWKRRLGLIKRRA